MEEYINILVRLDTKRMGIGGEKYPSSGFIISKNFSVDDDVRTGITGILNGDCRKYFLKWLNQGISAADAMLCLK